MQRIVYTLCALTLAVTLATVALPLAANALSDDEKMHRLCAHRWQDDYSMQLYCRKEQTQAAERMFARLKQHGVLKPGGGLQVQQQTPEVRVFLACYKRWEVAEFAIVDFAMLDYCLKEQFEAMRQLGQ